MEKKTKEKIQERDKIEFLRIALQLQKVGVNNEISERIIKTYEQILLLKGDFSIMDAIKIDNSIKKKYNSK